jgi:hypothetical protein
METGEKRHRVFGIEISCRSHTRSAPRDPRDRRAEGANRACCGFAGSDGHGFRADQRQDGARRAIEEHRPPELSRRDSEAFVDALLNPKPVNDRLRATLRRYREATGI